MNKNRGFTVSELLVTLVVVGILALIAVPSYRKYVRNGIAAEGKSLLGEINAAQQIYYSRHGQYYAGTGNQQYGTSFGVDARRNKYFTSYSLQEKNDAEGTFVFVTNEYDGQVMTVKGSLNAEPEIIDNFSGNK